MSDIQFEEQTFAYQNPHEQKPKSAFANFLIEKEVVKTETQANLLLIAISMIFLGLSIYIGFFLHLPTTSLQSNTPLNQKTSGTYVYSKTRHS